MVLTADMMNLSMSQLGLSSAISYSSNASELVVSFGNGTMETVCETIQSMSYDGETGLLFEAVSPNRQLSKQAIRFCESAKVLPRAIAVPLVRKDPHTAKAIEAYREMPIERASDPMDTIGYGRVNKVIHLTLGKRAPCPEDKPLGKGTDLIIHAYGQFVGIDHVYGMGLKMEDELFDLAIVEGLKLAAKDGVDRLFIANSEGLACERTSRIMIRALLRILSHPTEITANPESLPRHVIFFGRNLLQPYGRGHRKGGPVFRVIREEKLLDEEAPFAVTVWPARNTDVPTNMGELKKWVLAGNN